MVLRQVNPTFSTVFPLQTLDHKKSVYIPPKSPQSIFKKKTFDHTIWSSRGETTNTHGHSWSQLLGLFLSGLTFSWPPFSAFAAADNEKKRHSLGRRRRRFLVLLFASHDYGRSSLSLSLSSGAKSREKRAFLSTSGLAFQASPSLGIKGGQLSLIHSILLNLKILNNSLYCHWKK